VRSIVLEAKVHNRLYRLRRRRRRIGYCSPGYERYINFGLLQYIWDYQMKQDQRARHLVCMRGDDKCKEKLQGNE